MSEGRVFRDFSLQCSALIYLIIFRSMVLTAKDALRGWSYDKF